MMTLLRQEPNNARARPSSLIKEDTVYNSLFSEDYPIDAYLVAADLTRRIEIALKLRSDLAARDRNNLRFYCLLWIASWEAKSASISASQIASLKGKVTEAEIEMGIDSVTQLFFDNGATDQLAKGSEFKDTMIQALKAKIKAHFVG